jgi:hypothetical protein
MELISAMKSPQNVLKSAMKAILIKYNKLQADF